MENLTTYKKIFENDLFSIYENLLHYIFIFKEGITINKITYNYDKSLNIKSRYISQIIVQNGYSTWGTAFININSQYFNINSSALNLRSVETKILVSKN